MRPTRRVESGAFPPPTNSRVTPPWLRGGGHLLSLNGYDGGGGGGAHIVVVAILTSPSIPRLPAPPSRGSQRFASLYPRELSPPSPSPPRSADLAAESRTLDISNATSQRGDIRLFRKVVKCTARLRGEGWRCWRRRRPDRDIGYGIAEFHCRIPPAWRAEIRGLLRSRIPVAYSALNACLPDSRTVQISDVSLARRLILTTVQLFLRSPPCSIFRKERKRPLDGGGSDSLGMRSREKYSILHDEFTEEATER